MIVFQLSFYSFFVFSHNFPPDNNQAAVTPHKPDIILDSMELVCQINTQNSDDVCFFGGNWGNFDH